MSELIDSYKPRIARWTRRECDFELEVIDKQINVLMSDAQSAGQQVETGLTTPFKQTFAEVIENRRLQIMELQELRTLVVERKNSQPT